jgi:hypothetical protein
MSYRQGHDNGPAGVFATWTKGNDPGHEPAPTYEGNTPHGAANIYSIFSSTRIHASDHERRPLLPSPPRPPEHLEHPEHTFAFATFARAHIPSFLKIGLAWVIVLTVYSRIFIPREVKHYKTLYDISRVEAESLATQVGHYKTLYDGVRVKADSLAIQVEHYKTLYHAAHGEAESLAAQVGHYKTLYDGVREKADSLAIQVEHYKTLYHTARGEADSLAKTKMALESQVSELGARLIVAKVNAFWEMARTMDTHMFVA